MNPLHNSIDNSDDEYTNSTEDPVEVELDGEDSQTSSEKVKEPTEEESVYPMKEINVNDYLNCHSSALVC